MSSLLQSYFEPDEKQRFLTVVEPLSTSQWLTGIVNVQVEREMSKRKFALAGFWEQQEVPKHETNFDVGSDFRLVDVPKIKSAQRKSRFEAIQKWDGHVVNIDKENKTFEARLTDSSAPRDADSETVEFMIDDLTDDKLSLLTVGAVFVWSVGYHYDEYGTKRRSSDLVFRRMPVWTIKDFEESEQIADETAEGLRWD